MQRSSREWALAPFTRGSMRRGDPAPTKQDTNAESDWGNKMIQSVKFNSQWTTRLGESLVMEVLKDLGHNVFKPDKRENKKPDLETDEFVVEVKTRTWTTSGTAGEKVLGVPYKYADVPTLWGKPLLIVCVAYQEWELTHGNTQIFGTRVSPEQKMLLDLWKRMRIHFIPFSKIVNGHIKDLTAYIQDEHSQVGGWKETDTKQT